MKATTAKIQAHIDATYPGLDINFYKCPEGYFYFSGESDIAMDVESIYVFALNQMSLETWLKRVDKHIEEAIERAKEKGPEGSLSHQ